LNRTKTIRREQESTGIVRDASIDAEIEAILGGEEELIPSSGFLASVMERVQQEAALPPPVPFLWKWAAPGVLLASGGFGWGAFELVHLGGSALDLSALDLSTLNVLTRGSLQLPAAFVAPVEQAGWVALGLGASLLSWLLSRHLAGSGGLL
jgi:hypothetical protein